METTVPFSVFIIEQHDVITRALVHVQFLNRKGQVCLSGGASKITYLDLEIPQKVILPQGHQAVSIGKLQMKRIVLKLILEVYSNGHDSTIEDVQFCRSR
jgi:hypothetical protein